MNNEKIVCQLIWPVYLIFSVLLAVVIFMGIQFINLKTPEESAFKKLPPPLGDISIRHPELVFNSKF